MSETSYPTTGCIVVGYDGSDVARAALAFAARRAGRDRELVIVYAHGSPPDWVGRLSAEEVGKEQESHARELLAEARDEPALQGLAHETELAEGRPAEALAEVARKRGATEIVVGSRGFGGASTIGSVSHELLRIADRPVVVVPRPSGGPGEAERKPLHADVSGHRRSMRHGSAS